MAGIFTAHDLLELAMQVERNGFSFYRAIEGSAKAEPVRGVCRFLAGEEEKHLALFQRLLDSEGRRPLPESYSGEYQAYIEALASSRVFAGEGAWKRLAQEARSDADALNTAILFEKDTILFFSEMKGLLAQRDQPILAEIVAQEKGHIRRLVEVRDRSGAQGGG